MKLGELKENINQKQAGASLIETLVAFGLLSIIAVAFLSGLATSLTGTLTAKEQATAESLARGELDFIKSSSYGSTTSTQARTATGAFSDIISGLSSDTTYHYRAVASGDGTAYGADRTFTTPTSPPQLSSGATFGLDGGDSVDQSAWFNMQRFENTAGTGTLSKLEVLISDSAPSGNIRLGVYADNNRVPGGLLLDAGEVALKNGWVDISGLSLPVTDGEYYWLAYVPRNRVGIVYQSTAMPADSHLAYQYAYGPLPGTPGAGSVNDTTFVMRATVSATPPSVATGAAGSITTSGATLNGSLTDLGTASSVGVKFEYGLTSGYGSTTSIQARTATGAFSDIISGLSSSTPYHYRAVAVGDGTSYGTDRTFTTAAPAPPSVTTEDTFGLDGGDSVDQSAWFNMQRFENTAGTGTLNKLEVLISDSAPSGNIRLGVYADNNGVPGE
ncbi:MAG: hypothetical protein Q8O55_12865, partial [Dehalococcoidales bacterium]|nr:hypothetical protein [Dehalococcoidales bacterium]